VLELLRAQRRNVKRILIAEQQDPAEILDQIEDIARRRRIPVQLGVLGPSRARSAHRRPSGRASLDAQRLDTVSLEDLLDDDAFLLVADSVVDPATWAPSCAAPTEPA
jgi:hypothetical protein